METVRIVDVLMWHTGLPNDASESAINAAAELLAMRAERDGRGCVPLTPEIPNCVDHCRIIECGEYKVRYMRVYSVEDDEFVCRLDLLLGVPEGASEPTPSEV